MPLDSPPPLRPENLPEIQHRPQPKNNWLLPTILIGTPIATLLFIICLAMFVVALVFRQLYIGELLHGLFGNGGTNSGQVVDCSGVTGVKIPQEYLPWIQDAAKKWMGGDEAALIAVIQHESSFQADAHNPGGATGLGQFMHDTAIGYNEFKGGDDGKGTVWSPGVLDGSGQDARYDPKRSIYATAHKFGAAMQHHNGNVGEAYEFDYHTVGRHNEYLAEALKGRADVERIYQQLKAGGGCHEVNSGGSNGGVTGGGNAANGGYLQVPGVKEGAAHECGVASVSMVILFYNPSINDPGFNQMYNRARNQSNHAIGCVSPGSINIFTQNKDWDFNNDPPATGIEEIKRSLAGGDPVVFYSNPGAIFDDSKHIFVIVGYDPKDDTFWVNNPNVQKCECYPPSPTKTPNGHRMTASHLMQYFGGHGSNPAYSHSMIIRSKYVGGS